MKFNNTYYLYFLVCLISFTACQEDLASDIAKYSQVVDLSSPENFDTSTNELGIYTGRYMSHNRNVNIRSTYREHADGESSFDSRITAWSLDGAGTPNRTLVNGGDFTVNDLKIVYENERYNIEGLEIGTSGAVFINDFIQNNVLGKTLNFVNTVDNRIVAETSFYVPHHLILDGLSTNKIPETNLIKMDRNAEIVYNFDQENENGLIVSLAYRGNFFGMTLDDLQNPSPVNIRRAIHVKEESPNGLLKLPSAFFDGIPTNAIVTIHVGRGGGSLFEHDGQSYHINSSSEQQFDAVLN